MKRLKRIVKNFLYPKDDLYYQDLGNRFLVLRNKLEVTTKWLKVYIKGYENKGVLEIMDKIHARYLIDPRRFADDIENTMPQFIALNERLQRLRFKVSQPFDLSELEGYVNEN